MGVELLRFTDAPSLEASLAETVIEALRDGIYRRGRASMVVSGGRTPRALFERLAATGFAWDRVAITLADERWVPPEHPDSNERTVREVLLRSHAAQARFVPLYNGAADPWSGLSKCSEAIAALPRPFDVVLLGMGADGHTASYFPAQDQLPPPSPALGTHCLGVRPTQAPHDRISLTMPTLLDARLLALHLSGAEKWSVLCDALAAGPAEAMPVRHVLHQDRVPCRVYWNP